MFWFVAGFVAASAPATLTVVADRRSSVAVVVGHARAEEGGSIGVSSDVVTDVDVEIDGVHSRVFARFAAAGRYEVRANPCSSFEVRRVVDNGAAGASRTLVLQAGQQALLWTLNASDNGMLARPGAPVVVEVPVSAMCAGAPVRLTAGDHSVDLVLFDGQHASVSPDVDAPVIGDSDAGLAAACAAHPRVAVVANADVVASAGVAAVAALRAAGCLVVRGPAEARQRRETSMVFARTLNTARPLAAALGAELTPLTWASDVDIVIAVGGHWSASTQSATTPP